MPFDAMQTQAVREWFRTKLGNAACPGCGGKRVVVGDLVRLAYLDQDLRDVGDAMPAVMVRCPGCGGLQLFDATVVGVIAKG